MERTEVAAKIKDKRENPDYADWNTQLEAFDQYKAEQQEQ